MLANRDIKREKREFSKKKPGEKLIRVLFVSNYLSLHQVAVWDKLASFDDVDFVFLRTGTLDDEDSYPLLAEHRGYSCNSHNDMDTGSLSSLIDNADFLIRGSVEDDRVRKLLRGRPAAYACEHFSKERSLRLLLSWIKNRMLGRKSFIDLDLGLCMSSHAAYDFFLNGMTPNQIWKFGYFPYFAVPTENDIALKDPFSLLYVGRLIEWKHPENAIFALKSLKKMDKRWHLDIYGTGHLQDALQDYTAKLGLTGSVVFHGFNDYGIIQDAYRKSSFFVFPSDYGEGWGVVLSEAMAQGCVCFANDMAGSSRYLIKHKRNGFLFKNRSGLCRCLRCAANASKFKLESIRNNAIATINVDWSGELAGERLHDLILHRYENKPFPGFSKGPVAKAFSRFGLINYLVRWVFGRKRWKNNKLT